MPKRQAPYYQHASQSTEGATGQAGPSGSQDSIVANNRVFGRLISYASVTSASGQKAYYWIQSQPAANGAWADDSYGLACTAVASGQQTGYAWEVNGTSTLAANSIVELEYMGGVLDARGESWRIVLSSQGASSFTLAGRTGTPQTISSGDTLTLNNGTTSNTDTWTPDVASASLAGIVNTSAQTLGDGVKTLRNGPILNSTKSDDLTTAYGPVIAVDDDTYADAVTGLYCATSSSLTGSSKWIASRIGLPECMFAHPNIEAYENAATNNWMGLGFDTLETVGSGTGRLVLFSSETAVGTTAAYAVQEGDQTTIHNGATGTSGGGDTVKGGIITALGSALTGFTDELAQDAVGNIFTDSSTIDFTYDDGAPSITAAAIYQMSITADASGLKLSGDSASPGNSYYYGTNGGGTKGYYALPQAADVGAMTDSTGGTANTTLVAIAGTGDDTNLNDNFADLVAQINALRTALRNAGLMA